MLWEEPLSPKYSLPLAAGITGLAAIGILVVGVLFAHGYRTVLPAPALDETVDVGYETAVFAGGCFWGVQAVFEHTRGVTRAVAGYAGGDSQDATYDLVATGETGHAEAVEVTFNPAEVSYGKLLQIFFSVAHNPTELNRQGPDIGPQYRSVLFTTSKEQADVATAYIAQLSEAETYADPIVTKVTPLTGFYVAEEYHQDYVERHQDQIYVMMNDLPKLVSLKQMFPQMWQEQPRLVLAAQF